MEKGEIFSPLFYYLVYLQILNYLVWFAFFLCFLLIVYEFNNLLKNIK